MVCSLGICHWHYHLPDQRNQSLSEITLLVSYFYASPSRFLRAVAHWPIFPTRFIGSCFGQRFATHIYASASWFQSGPTVKSTYPSWKGLIYHHRLSGLRMPISLVSSHLRFFQRRLWALKAIFNNACASSSQWRRWITVRSDSSRVGFE
jgi:hypothetical protein